MPYPIKNTGIRIPDILLPNSHIDLYKWSVIACDQFTNNLDYWKKVENIVGDAPSSLRLILPEVYLKNENEIPSYLQNIRTSADKYCKEDVFVEHQNCSLVLDRSTPLAQSRKSIIVQVDLSCYESDPQNNSLIASTEKIVESRLHKRIEVRKSSNLDLSHVIMCYSDKQNTLISTLLNHSTGIAYQTELMCKGGEIKAHFCDTAKTSHILETFFTKLRNNNKNRALFAVGDGNHSLMAAKRTWQNAGANMNDANRWAMVELINIFDEGLSVKPIHRALFDVAKDHISPTIMKELKKYGTLKSYDSLDQAQGSITEHSKYTSSIVIYQKQYWTWIPLNTSLLAVETIENILQNTTADYKDIDFIHDTSDLISHTQDEKNLGIILPSFPRSAIFEYVHSAKLFPRKSFSLGEAEEKIYYTCACKR